jgi:hypothetical protein
MQMMSSTVVDSRTNTAILLGDSSVLSRHPPLASLSIVPNSTALPVHALSVVLEPILQSVFYAFKTQPKRKRVTGRPNSSSNPVQAQLNSLWQAYIGLSQKYIVLRSETSDA